MNEEELLKYMSFTDDKVMFDKCFYQEVMMPCFSNSITYKNIVKELEKENQQLKEQLEKYQIENFNLREDIIIKKMSFPIKEIRDKSLLELYNMPSYEDLKKENKKLKEKQKEFIEWLNNIINNLEKEQTKRFNHSYQYKLNSFNNILSKYKEIIGDK